MLDSVILQESNQVFATLDQMYIYGPRVAVIGLILFALWWIWAWVTPAEPGGDILGMFSVVGRLPGTRVYKILRGTLVDCTEKLIGPHIDEAFRMFLYEAIMDQLHVEEKQPSPDNQALQRLKWAANVIYQYPFKSFLRIVALKHADHKRHYLIQMFHITKRLDQYASHSMRPYFSWAFGFLTRGVITGVIWSVPDSIQRTWIFKGRAGAKFHFFCPDDYAEQDKMLVAPNVAIAQAIEVAQPFSKSVAVEKLLRRRVKESERGRKEAYQENAALSTAFDGMFRMTRALRMEKGIPTSFGRRFNMNDVMMAAGGAALAGAGMWYVRPDDPFSIIAGSIAGMVVVLSLAGGR